MAFGLKHRAVNDINDSHRAWVPCVDHKDRPDRECGSQVDAANVEEAVDSSSAVTPFSLHGPGPAGHPRKRWAIALRHLIPPSPEASTRTTTFRTPLKNTR
jgi:hypothetical protein